MPEWRNGAAILTLDVGAHESRSYPDGWRLTRGDGRAKKPRDFRTREAAYAAYHAAVADAQRDGFALALDGETVTAPAPAPAPASDAARFAELADLERAVDDADAGDPTALAALADAWAAAGDPRGEAVQLERSLQGTADPASFLARKRAMAGARRLRDAHTYGSLGGDAYRLRARFAHGLVDRIELRDEQGAPGAPTRALLARALANPFARFTRELAVVGEAAGAAAAIAETPRGLRALRTVSLADPDARIDLAAASQALPRVVRLDLDVAGVDFTAVALPALDRLELTLWHPTVDDVAALLAWISDHPTLARVGVRTNPTGADLVDAWQADARRRPATLTGFAWSPRGLPARRP